MITPDCIERSNRKTLSLSVLKDGRVVVKAPIRMRDDAIMRFVEEKQGWIQEKISLVCEGKMKFEEIFKLKKILIYGKAYDIRFANVKRIGFDNGFTLLVPEKFSGEKLVKNLVAWYKKVANQILSERIRLFEEKTKMKSSMVRINDCRSRWGSCNNHGVIAFNYRVVMLPAHVIDYVIVHELCHLAELNHSKNFWMLVQKFYPNYMTAKQDIKKFGMLLSLYN